jgi:hypothetical protein
MRLSIVLAFLSLWQCFCKGSEYDKYGGIMRSKRAVFDLIPVNGGHAMQRRTTSLWSEVERRRVEEDRREELRRKREKLKLLFKHAMKRQGGTRDAIPFYFFG